MDEAEKKTSNPTLLIVVLVLLVGGGVILFSKKSNNQPPQQAQQTAVTPTTGAEPTGTAMSDQTTQAFTVEGGNFYFKPNEIRVKKGDKVKITFTNAGGLHDFVLDEFNVKTDRISSGAKTTVEFTADKAGTFEYYCSVANHRQMGMKGNLIVE